ncbi:MAG: ribosome biogenesis GTP-binding protein YihA/YsxC [Patescibacteria group bacterium]
MEIKSAKFIKGIIGADDILYDGILQIAFFGRSNVGKSSVINSLVNRKNLVKSSNRPGKTQRLDFFLINNNTYFVDIPGYGFAKIPKNRREKLRKLILWYLLYSEVENRKIVLIIDAKVGPTSFDIEMIELLQKNNENIIIIANKIDKLKKNDIKKQIQSIIQEIKNDNVIPYSAKTKQGREELLLKIFE